jgi:hypothetical protein
MADLTRTQQEICDNIRRDMDAAGVPWEKFQRMLAWVTLSKLCSDQEYAFHASAPRLWKLCKVRLGPGIPWLWQDSL